jgi:pyrimidine deaminase RibD-like protein
MVLAVWDSSGTRNVSWAPCPAVVESGKTPTCATALVAVPITAAATKVPTAAARPPREEVTGGGRMSRKREMTVMMMESFEAGLSAHAAQYVRA